ncbi:MAG: alpha-glucosidase [Erysipelotrichia bacterium]|nr:alpha-glucosidase [Erysipelotrichia bacterium]
MREWWKEAIGYEIYPSSFYDSNNDGIGDLKGIIAKLDYLATLGVNLLWICPFFVSPFDDCGYDVKDYLHVDARFGSDEDMKELINKAHQKGMRIIIDLVMNHTSDEHSWFVDACSNDASKKDYYIWQKGKKDRYGKLQPPNNWSGFFSDSAWCQLGDSGDFYLKIFSKKMPDLNWENKQLREEMYAIARQYLDMGIDGFRMDAIAHLAKDLTFQDSKKALNEYGLAEDWSKFSNLPRLFTYLKEFKEKVLDHYDCVSIGEVGGEVTPRQALQYVNYRQGCCNMVFNFDSVWVHSSYGNEYKEDELISDVVKLKEVFYMWIANYGKQAWYPLYWMNHDHPRVVSQYGDIAYRNESAKMLAMVLLFMGGTPFLYNGEEIGMSNVTYQHLSQFKDVSAQNFIAKAKATMSEEEILTYLRRASRVNARTPMQWNDSRYAGFSKAKPYLDVNDNYKQVNVQQQLHDPHSIFHFYRQLIQLRKEKYQDVVLDGELRFVDIKHKDVFAYRKDSDKMKIAVIANFRNHKVPFTFDFKVKNIILHNYEEIKFNKQNIELRPFECVLFEIE